MSEAQESQCSQCRKSVDALQLGPRKRPRATDLLMGELAEIPEENFTAEYVTFLQSWLKECLMQGGKDEVDAVTELASISVFYFTKGASGARGDDTKSLKGSVLDCITPKGQSLVPPLARNVPYFVWLASTGLMQSGYLICLFP
ncbi:uncharacterized protein F5147DRAFT_650037 [Suillus discolor]|uniref:Uncharacterized protein n=1 Tax=Suillus discolor TaxID=1912936 RepID=A0A9P7FEA1_9AGAM|nr:uncharacterized protein F5147DRAFT_650037 [Suillus discolor]KAG2114230.1 hypothetical protein F5147DRAFT_650037 [Suillus discolor]